MKNTYTPYIVYSHPESDCIFISEEEMSDDTLCVEICRLSRPDKEVVWFALQPTGISKELFDLMFKEYVKPTTKAP